MPDPAEADTVATFEVGVPFRGTLRPRLRLSAPALTVGSRDTSDLAVADPVAAGEHCRVSHDGRGFSIEDCGTATGTFLNGLAVRGPVLLGPGDRVVLGVTLITVQSMGESDGRPSITLALEENRFRFARGRSGFFESDPDLWARTEVGLGRFPALRLGNALALLLVGAGLLLLFAEGPRNRLLEPGPLCRSHGRLFQPERPAAVTPAEYELARTLGCRVCHDPLTGAPMEKCAQCHRELTEGHHPFKPEPDPTPDPDRVSRAWSSDDCARCHVEHRGDDSREGGFVPAIDEVSETCEDCHRGTALALASYPPARELVEVAFTRRWRFSPYRFGHRDHLRPERAVPCSACHEPEPDALADLERGTDDRLRRDFLRVPYETCAGCHVEGRRDPALRAWWPDDEHVWAVRWHGTDEDGRYCAACHARTSAPDGTLAFGADLRQVRRFRFDRPRFLELKARYALARRSHAGEFAAHAGARACSECHRREETVLALVEVRDRPFRHAVHMPGIDPGDPAEARALAETCLDCHRDLRESEGLADAEGETFFYRCAPEPCETCHLEEPDRPLVPRQLVPPRERLAGIPLDPTSDFPHRFHVDFREGGPLELGCFTCHGFEAPAGEGLDAIPTTRPETRQCVTCHAKHDNVGGGACRQCHPMPDGEYNVYLGSDPPPGRPPPERPWPEPNAFNHFSLGHRDWQCALCHQVGRGAANDLSLAATLREVPVPNEGYEDADPALREQKLNECRKCHLSSRRRFHWR